MDATSAVPLELWAKDATGPLSGVRVVDFGQYLAGPMLAMLLADQGARVIRVDPPGGPRWDTPVNAVLLRGRRNVSLDLADPGDRIRAQKLIATADVVIENFRPGTTERLGISPSQSCARSPRLVYCSLPGFGSSDPRAGVAAWEGVVMAAAGAYTLQQLFAPTTEMGSAFSPLPLASVFAAIQGAVAVTAALIARERDGVGQYIEISLFDGLFQASGALGVSYDNNPMTVADFGVGWYRCADGRYVLFEPAYFRHLEWFVRGIGHEDWINEGLVDFAKMTSEPTAGLEVRARLADAFAKRAAADWEAFGREHGCPLNLVRSMAEWMIEEHAIASGTLADWHDPLLGPMRGPGVACESSGVRSIAHPRRVPDSDGNEIRAALDSLVDADFDDVAVAVPADEAKREPPLAGLRVLDFSRVVAAPTSAKLLAELGADVIKIDQDQALTRPMISQPIFHEYLNRGKRSICLDLGLDADRAVLDSLLADTDAIVQNFTLGAAERLRIDPASVQAINPDIVYLYLNAYGRRGPWATSRGFAELANITTGVTERTLDGGEVASGTMAGDVPRWIFTDFAGGVLGAFGVVLGLYGRARGQQAGLVETSLVRATAHIQAMYLLGYDGRDVPEPRGTAPGWSPLQRLYATIDGTVFVGAGRDQTERLLAALDATSADDLGAAFAQRTTDAVCSLLTDADVGVHPIVSLSSLMTPGGIAEQRGLRLVDETDRFGTVVMPGPIARYSGTALVAGPIPKPFGDDGDEIRAQAGTEPE